MQNIKWQDVTKNKPKKPLGNFSDKLLVWVEYPLQNFGQAMFANYFFIDEKYEVQDIGKPKGGFKITHFAEITEPLNY